MMKRRRVLKALAAGSASVIAFPSLLLSRKTGAAEAGGAYPDLVAVRNGSPTALLDRAMEEIGGLGRFVPKGSTVVVKPNIAWARGPETGANTNPELVKRLVELCLNVGAEKVYVFDHSVASNPTCYDKSGIEAAAKAGGATVVPGDNRGHYQDTTIPDATLLSTRAVHELILDSDVVINVPVLKHHGGTKATICLKNLMGVVWDRGAYHREGLQQCIAEFCLLKKPTLNIVDAYRVTMENGPQRARPDDIKRMRTLLVSDDIVTADAAAVRLLNYTPQQAEHIAIAAGLGVGSLDLDAAEISRVVL